MNGYLQCLIDQYEKLTKKALIPSERTIYIKVLTDLVGLQNFCKNDEKPTIDGVSKKYVLAGFKGDVKDFIKYLNDLKGGK